MADLNRQVTSERLSCDIKGLVVLSTRQGMTTLPMEMVAHIWSYMTIKDLLKWACTSRTNYALYRTALKSTIH